MTEPRPLLITTLTANNVDQALAELSELGSASADIAELRLDGWQAETLAEVGRLFPSALPLMATYRSRAEGGRGLDDSSSRAERLRAFAGMGFAYLDVEAERDGEAARAIRAARPSLRLVVSEHFPDQPTRDVWSSKLVPPDAGTAFSKVVFPCGISALVRDVLGNLPAPDFPYVVHTTGASGPLLRAWGRRLGLAAVYSGPPSRSGRHAVEPSQLPVDRLRRFFDASGHPPLFAVVGHPIAHSRSPELHSNWMERDRRAGLYIALDIGAESDLIELLPVLGTHGFRGLNVTHPLKEAALAASTQASVRADACGSANVLTFEEGEILADNTDVIAISRRLTELRQEGWDGTEICLLGSGSAARATLAAARELGLRCGILARNRKVAADLADRYDGYLRRETDGEASLVVNATPVGHLHAGALGLSVSGVIGTSTRVLDWVYGGAGPGLRDLARSLGATYEDGSTLLTYQAAASYELWWEAPPPATPTVPTEGEE